MALAIGTISSITTTGASVALTGLGVDPDGIDYWIADDPDFRYTPYPVISAAHASPLAVAGLNQRGTYYIKARETTAGVPGPWTAPTGFRTADGTARDTSPASVLIRPAMIVAPVPVLAWSADSEIAGHPARCCDRDDPNTAWWSQAAIGEVALEMVTAGGPVDTIALLGTNAPDAATVVVKAGADLANVRGGTPSYATSSAAFRASANLPQRRAYHGLIILPAPQSYPVWRIEITGTYFGGGFTAAHAVLGLNRISKNYSADMNEIPVDLGTMSRNRDGSPDRAKGFRMRRVSFDLSLLTETQYETQYRDLDALAGATDPVLVVPNSRAGSFLHDRLLYGQLSAGKVAQPGSARFTRSFTVDSLI